MNLQTEGPGTNCATGGVRVESGLDRDGDDVLQPAEVEQTAYVCNGASSSGSDGGAGGAPGCQGLRCAGARPEMGAAVSYSKLGEPTYAAVLNREFAAATPENELKWGSLQPSRHSWNFATADALIDALEANGQTIKGHTLVWHDQNPAWLSGLSKEEARAAVEAHITKTVARYRERVRVWDVVNEALGSSPYALRSGLHEQLGVEGLADAFKWAHAADPDAILLYNDFGIESPGPKTDAVYALLEQLLALGAPIHGIGLQTHISTAGYPGEAALRSVIQRFAGLGLSVSVSELDVRTMDTFLKDETSRFAAQQVAYQVVSAACALEPACDSVTTWGFTDAHYWNTGTVDQPLLFDAAYVKKPAYAGLLAGLRGTRPLESVNLAENGSCSAGVTEWIRTFGGGALGTMEGVSGPACSLSARTETFHGVGQSILGEVASGDTLSVSAWVRASAPTSELALTLRTIVNGETTFTRLRTLQPAPTQWTLMSVNTQLGWTGTPTTQQVYFEGPAGGVDIHVDELELRIIRATP